MGARGANSRTHSWHWPAQARERSGDLGTACEQRVLSMNVVSNSFSSLARATDSQVPRIVCLIVAPMRPYAHVENESWNDAAGPHNVRKDLVIIQFELMRVAQSVRLERI